MVPTNMHQMIGTRKTIGARYMLFKDEMWIQHPRLCVRPTGPMMANTTLQNLFMKRVYHTIRSPGDAQRVTLSSELSGNIQVRACVLYDKRKKRL